MTRFEELDGLLIELSSTRNPRQAFRRLRERFLKLREGERTSEISALLRGLADFSNEMSPLLLVGALRVTYLYRDDIPGWRESMNRMEKSLEARGFNVQSLLVGLKQ